MGRRAVKLPHSGVERKHIEVGTSENKATAELEKAKQQAETKETQVVKSEKSETSGSDRESGDRESGVAAAGAKLRTKTVSTSHENNLNVLIIIAGGLAWFLFR